MNNLLTYLKSALKWIAMNRLNYLATTSALLLIIHFPANLQLLLGLNLPEAMMTLLHMVVGTAWLAGFLPNRLLATASKKVAESTRRLATSFAKDFGRILSNYAQTH